MADTDPAPREPTEVPEPGVDPEPADIVVCCRHLVAVDLGTVDALARLAGAARRLGTRVRLAGVSPALRELLDLTGLDVSDLGRLEAPAVRTKLFELPVTETER